MADRDQSSRGGSDVLRFGDRPCRVLVVDDQPSVHSLVKYYVEAAGGEVIPAHNGEEALQGEEQCRQEGRPVDLVLLDMDMPVMDGYSTAEHLRARGFQRPVIALTARALTEDRDKCLAAGCDEYVTKPVDWQILIQLIARFAGEISADDLARRRSEHSARTVPSVERTTTEGERMHASQGRDVLLVDDSRDMCKLMEILLTRRGHAVRSVHSGRDAIEAARKAPPDVVLLDIGLPGMDGYQVVRELRQLPEMESALLIALSGRGELSDRAKSAEAGFHYHLTKPADMDELGRLLAGARPEADC